ncbi:PTS sugar transporter subunit IIA [Anaerovibrio sp.]|uniref:PTS sugar transporter subunit IIA n=1 Tax=Anaerovibrio sp. TaxID=1872532 RepID=UPI003F150F3B
MGEEYKVSIFAPMTGQVVDLGKVPDPIYADRMLGDGVAIVPEDGTMFSPISGYINVIAEDKHAFGFTSDEGLEVLVHFGVNSKLMPDCCAVHTTVNSRVQAGDMIAEFDLEKIKAMGVDTITPVIICGGLEGKVIRPATGHAQAGSGAVITVVDAEQASQQAPEAKDAASAAGAKQSAWQEKAEKRPAGRQESEALEFLRDRKNWPALIGGFVGLTVALVIVFVGVAMLIGH